MSGSGGKCEVRRVPGQLVELEMEGDDGREGHSNGRSTCGAQREA